MDFSMLGAQVAVKTVSEERTRGVFEVEGLFSGYGLTVGNALRRVLLSSLPGAAVTELKIKSVSHEFSTLPGVQEDIVEINLNFKKVRLRMHTDEPQVLTLKAKGMQTIRAADIAPNALVEIINPDQALASLTAKDAELDMEIKVERGLGYLPVEARKEARLAIGTIAIDAIFTPVLKVNYGTENMRVGERTDYDRLRLEIETDGTISPSRALQKAATILKDHFEKIMTVPAQEFEAPRIETHEAQAEPKKRSRKKET